MNDKASQISTERPPLYPAAWGWNSGGRAGNVTEDEIRSPKQLQRSNLKDEYYIGAAAGQHHSLLVSDQGRIYALGEGRRGQLGLGNQFTGPLKKGGTYQAFPRMVTPSGAYKYKKDVKIGQVAAGGSFSVARELSVEEGIDIVIGFRELERAIIGLKDQFYDSSSIIHAWSSIRQERFLICRQGEGRVLTWGTGERGELGLGVLGKLSWYPQPVWKLNNVCITYIAAGAKHVLAIDSRGRLFSWGCGAGGRLGHGDFNDRETPEIVMFYASLYAESCSAGDAHSAVLTTMRAGNRNSQIRRISTFGRGAHGRLGNGTNRNKCTPILVSQWLPSLENVQFHQVACGGAHTLALASKIVPQGIANPRGRETFVVCWGYGKNGQLGTGYRYDSFIPVKARMPRWDIITEISAGRSWSMAKSAGGELYTWGKGMRGQLGQGPEKFCLAPRKVESFASFVRISSGYAHNVCITTPKKFLNTAMTEEKARHDGRSYDPFDPYIKSTLKTRHSSSLYSFDCCRRTMHYDVAPWRKRIRFRCLDCISTSICLACAKLCHRGHRVSAIDPSVIEVTENLEAEEPVTHASDFMPYRCAVMYLAKPGILRPKRGSLECMPRLSIFDLSKLLKREVPILKGQKTVVQRRTRESNKENEVNQKYLEVDRTLHYIAKPSKEQHIPTQDHRKFRHLTATKKISKKPISGTSEKSQKLAVVPTSEVNIKVPCCRCGVFNRACRLIPVIPEDLNENMLHLEEFGALQKRSVLTSTDGTVGSGVASDIESPQTVNRKRPAESILSSKKANKSRKSGKSKKIDLKEQPTQLDPDARRNHLLRRYAGIRHLAARRIQRIARVYMRKCRDRKEKLEYIILRREVCAEHFQKKIVDVVFSKVWKEYGNYREIQEQAAMAHEESLTKAFTYYIKLQQSIIGIEALSYGIRQLCGMMSPMLPRVTVDGVITDQIRPTFAHTYNSIRAQQLRLPSIRRVPAAMLAIAARNVPLLAEGTFKEGKFSDTDLMMLSDRFLKDQMTETWRFAKIAAAEKAEELRRKIAAIALERLKAKQNATKLAMQQAEALTLKNNQKARAGPPPPPPGPPPRFMVVRAAMEAKEEKRRKYRMQVREMERLEDAEFSIVHKGLATTWRKKRYSIADPSDMYKRLSKMRSTLVDSNRIKRRNSLPGKMNLMYMPAQETPLHRIEQVQQSLELFTQRLGHVKRVQERTIRSRVDGSYLDSSKRRPDDTYVHWASRLFQTAVINPRLPCEMNYILVDGYRRRTIGEPERLARQLRTLMDTREVFCEFVESTQENFKYRRRRRSFDHGEYLDAVFGVTEAIGFEFEEVKTVSATITGLKKDSVLMEKQMVKAKFIEASAFAAQEEEVELTANLANRFAKPGVGTGASAIGKKVARKDKAKGGLKAVRLGIEKVAEEQPEYDFASFDDSAHGYGYQDQATGYEYNGTLQPYDDDGYDNAYDYGGEGYTSEYEGTQSMTQVGYWGESDAEYDYGEGAHVWQEHYTESGKAYYYNPSTGASSWEMPIHVDTQIETQNQDEAGNWYWFNSVTGESKWM